MDPNIIVYQLLDESDLQNEVQLKQDEFLDLYSLYRKTQIPWIKEELLKKAYELHILNPSFTFLV